MKYTILLLVALLCQYTFAGVADTIFELDGNPNSQGGEDWDTLYNNLGTSKSFSGIDSDPYPQSIFTGGGSKDVRDIPYWQHTDGSVPNKDDITHAFAASYVFNDEVYIFFGVDRYANNGDSTVGFWFFQNKVQLLPDGTFSGVHKTGDIFVLANFGSSQEVLVYEWDNGDLILLFDDAQAKCQPGVSTFACAIINEIQVDSPWEYEAADGTVNAFPTESFMEGGVILNQLFPESNLPCFSSFSAVTRSSSSLNAQLKDLAINEFKLCGLNVDIECTGGVVDATKTTIVYDYYSAGTNIGFGNLYNVQIDLHSTIGFGDLGLSGDTTNSVATLAPSTSVSLSGTIHSVVENLEVLYSTLEGYVVPNSTLLDDQLSATSGVAQCPYVPVYPGFQATISCTDVQIDQVTEEYVYSYAVSVENTGFGYVYLYESVITFNGQNLDVFSSLDSSIPPTGNTITSASGTIRTTQVIDHLEFYASVTDFKGVLHSDTDNSLTCPTPPINPAIDVTKFCDSFLFPLNNKIVVKVNVTGAICNTGDIKLKNIALSDDLGTISNTDDITFSESYLYSGDCVDYSHYYYPEFVSFTFSDIVVVSADVILGLGTVSDSVSASCSLCP